MMEPGVGKIRKQIWQEAAVSVQGVWLCRHAEDAAVTKTKIPALRSWHLAEGGSN